MFDHFLGGSPSQKHSSIPVCHLFNLQSWCILEVASYTKLPAKTENWRLRTGLLENSAQCDHRPAFSGSCLFGRYPRVPRACSEHSVASQNEPDGNPCYVEEEPHPFCRLHVHGDTPWQRAFPLDPVVYVEPPAARVYRLESIDRSRNSVGISYTRAATHPIKGYVFSCSRIPLIRMPQLVVYGGLNKVPTRLMLILDQYTRPTCS